MKKITVTFIIIILLFTYSNTDSYSDSCADGCAEVCAEVAVNLAVQLLTYACLELSSQVLIPYLSETLSAYYKTHKGAHIGFELAFFGGFGNFPDQDENKLNISAAGGGSMILSLRSGTIVSLDFGLTYRFDKIDDEMTKTDYIHTSTQFAGIKAAFFGLYFCHNLYMSRFFKDKVENDIGAAYEIFIPLLPSRDFNFSPYFKHQITFSKNNVEVKGDLYNPHLFEIGAKISF